MIERLKTININLTTLVFVIYILFVFSYFFYNKIIFTPDFGQSDAYYINYMYKYFIWKNLHSFRLPFWTDQLQNGLPLLGESQSGLLYLPNLLLLLIPDFYLGYSLIYVFTISITAIGVYFLLKELKIDNRLSLIIALNFPFGFAFSLKWVHLNSIESYSLIPLTCFSLIKLLKNKEIKWFLISTVLIQQSVFAGNIPASFISILSVAFFTTIFVFANSKNVVKDLITVYLNLIAGIFLTLPHIFPVIKYTQFTNKLTSTDYNYAVSFPFTPKNLIEFILPFANGNPKYGSYPDFNSASWSTFWENGSYLGYIFSVLSLAVMIKFIISLDFLKKNIRLATYSLCTVVFFLLLALGKYSPLYFLFNLPPFVFFRTPGRYLIPTVFFLTLFTAIVLDKIITKKKILKLLILTLFIINLFILTIQIKNYHLLLSKETVQTTPEILKYIPKQAKIASLDMSTEWNKVFKTNGWQSNLETSAYLFFKNYIYANSSLIYDLRDYTINTGGLKSIKTVYLESILTTLLNSNNCEHLSKYLQIINADYLISKSNLNCLKHIKTFSFDNNKYKFTIHLYKTKNNKNIVYIPDQIKTAIFLEDFDQIVSDQFTDKIAILELSNLSKNSINKIDHIEVISKTDTYLEFKTKNNQPGYVIIDKLLTPEWNVFVNSKKSNFVRANLIQSAIYLPSGDNTVKVVYTNRYFKTGIAVGFTGFIITLVLYKLLLNKILSYRGVFKALSK
ncbi:MAG: hypothetical protein KatS3mg090_0919 [Patescibacteria group bacterium]|nr:MAG: hypothetical protein KatS3mg090_0919 [Patescibacteria group bacterium]